MSIFDLFRRKKKVQRRQIARRNIKAGTPQLLTATWTSSPMNADQIVHRYLRVLRARSREQFENNDYARRFTGLLKSNVVGPKGVVLQSRVTRSNGTPDEPARNALESAWNDWGKSADITGRLSWIDIQNLFIQTVAIDGEFLAVKMTGRSVNKWNYAISIIDPERLDSQYVRDDKNIRAGIEYDSLGRPVAYHFAAEGDENGYVWRGARYVRVPASRVYHCFLTERVGQKRGLPWMSSALQRMWMLEGYQEAAVTAARIGAAKMGFFIPPDGDTMIGPEDSAGNLVSEVEPGLMEQLPPGTEFQAFDAKYPHEQFDDFVKAMLRSVASALGVSYHSLANDLEGVNFSSARTGTIEDRELYKALQEWMIRCFVQPVFSDWLSNALIVGIPIGNNGATLNALQQDRYENVSWQPRRWPWVDPLKDGQANLLAVKSRFTSISSIIRESGRDPDEVFREIQEEQQKLKEMGIEPEDIVTQEMGNEPAQAQE